MQAKLTPTQKRRKRLLGDVFLGLQNGNFGTDLPGWHDHGSISAIDIAHRQARLEDQDAGARARRRHDDRERSRLRRRRRRRAARVRREDRQGALDVPDRPPDRGRRVDLLGRRQGVRRDHLRRHADVVGRRHRQRAAGLHARRLAEGVAAAGAAGVRERRRSRTRRSRAAPSARAPGRRRAERRARSPAPGARIVTQARDRRAPVGRELVERPDDDRAAAPARARRSRTRGSASTATSLRHATTTRRRASATTPTTRSRASTRSASPGLGSATVHGRRADGRRAQRAARGIGQLQRRLRDRRACTRRGAATARS